MTTVHHGMKRLTIENWQLPDPTLALMMGTGEEWAILFLGPPLGPAVPDDNAKLFEAARGAIDYGYQFYPLFTLGNEQVLRVVETAIVYKCDALGLKPSRDNFDQRINILHTNHAIGDGEATMLQAIRGLRNEASHPKAQMIFTPAAASKILQNVMEQINLLFS